MSTSSSAALTVREKVEVLLEEYRALYALAVFRLQALDRRVPLAIGALVASLAAAVALPWEAQLVVMMAAPVSLVWVLRTTVGHARSFEDCLRRIERIEQEVNAIAGAELLGFQSGHPSRGSSTGGRTGIEAVVSVLLASGVVLAATGALAWATFGPELARLFLIGLASLGVYLIAMLPAFSRYRYQPQSGEYPPRWQRDSSGETGDCTR